jgi:arabinose-5-phosphate isomerase
MTTKEAGAAQLMRKVLEIEAAAVQKAGARLEGVAADQAIDLLVRLTGKVIGVGVGKSGIVARKIVSTLASAGVPAVFLHPADALHGGLGSVMHGDVAVAVSNSGETEDLLALLPALRGRKVPLIAIVGNIGSALAREANVVFDAGVDREACPLNLAPTASTTVALALGDAMAMAVMQVRGVTAEMFAVNHPAGRLGRRLTVKVRDLMHSGERSPSIAVDEPWIAVLAAITRGGLGAVNVVDERGMLTGLVTDGDLRRVLHRTETSRLEQLTVRDLMTANPVVVAPDELAYHALRLMENRPSQISVLPVVEAGRAVGMLRLHDIVGRGL